MQEVARAAGVSAITVSRALNTPEKLAPATLRAVRAAIEELRYVPDLTAGSLASRRSRIIAVVVPTIANSIFSDTIDALAQTVSRQRYQILLGQTHYRAAKEATLIDAFLGRRVDGLVLTGVTHGRGVRGRLRRAGIPVVETWDMTPRPIDMLVGFSNLEAGRAAAHYLLDKGYRSLAFIGGSDVRSTRRLEGFRRGARERGVAQVQARTVSVTSTPGAGRAALAGLLADTAPRAVFCSSDTLAAGALFECAHRGISVPEELAVMGLGDLPIAAAIEPALTSMQVRAGQIGEYAGEMLLARLAQGTLDERIVDLGFSVVQRASA